MKLTTLDGPRSIEERARLRADAEAAKRVDPDRYMERRSRVRGPRRTDTKWTVLGPDGEPYEGEAIALYVASFGPTHVAYTDLLDEHGKPIKRPDGSIVKRGYPEAKLEIQLALPEHDGSILSRWYRIEHDCPRVRWGDGRLCPRPDPPAGCDLVRELQAVKGRQIPGIMQVEDPDVIAGVLAPAGPLRVLVGRTGRRPDAPASKRYSVITKIFGRA